MKKMWKAINTNAIERNLYWLFFLAGLTWMIVLWSQSPGWYFLDEVEHVNLNRTAWLDYKLIWDFWGRTGYTLMYMVPSLFGINGARFFSTILAACIVLITTGVAYKLQIKRLYFIPLFMWFQPWYVDMMYAANTMIPMSFWMILGIYLWLDERPLWASLAFGVLPLMRNEAIFLTGLWGLYVLYRRDWRAAFVTSIPFILYNVTYLIFVSFDITTMPVASYLTPRDQGRYGYGHILYFVSYILWSINIPILFWFILGSLKTRWLHKEGLIHAFYWSYVALHTVIFMYGLFASGGYGFFVLPIAPSIALIASRGADFTIGMLVKNLQAKFIVYGYSILIGIIAVPVLIPAFGVPVRQLNTDALTISEAITWINDNGIDPDKIRSTHPYVFYNLFFGLDKTLAAQQAQTDLDSFADGTVLLWDKHFSNRLGWNLDMLIDPDNGWRELARFGKDDFIIIFQRT